MAASDVYRLSIVSECTTDYAAGLLCVNVLNYHMDGEFSISDFLDTWATRFVTKYRATLPDDFVLDRLDLLRERAPGGPPVSDFGTKAINLAGTHNSGTAQLSPGLCPMASFQTDVRSRNARGRIFLPPTANASDVYHGGGYNPIASYWTAIVAFLDELRTTMFLSIDWDGGWFPATDAALVVYSRTARARGDANWWFHMQGYRALPKQHFLRSRTTAP